MRRRLLTSALLAAAALGLIAVLTATQGDPPAERLPIVPRDASPLTSADALREFAGIAYADLAEEDWNGLALSLLPEGAPCPPEALALHAGAAQREAAEAMEAAVARADAGRAQFVRLPQVAWRIVGVNAHASEAAVARQAVALGRDVAPPFVREDRWVVADGAWWLDAESVAPGCGGAADAERPAVSSYDVPQGGSFERPLAPGTPVGAVGPDGRAFTLTLTDAERGVLPVPAQEGYEHVHVEVRVESADGSQLGLPPRFHSAAFDGWFLRESGPVSAGICPGTEDTGVTCQLIAGRFLVATDDPSPRLAWTIARAGERIEALAWWRLPTIEQDGEPVARILAPDQTARMLERRLHPCGRVARRLLPRRG